MFSHVLSYLPVLVVRLHKEYFHYFRGFGVVCLFVCFLNTVLLKQCSAFCMLLNRETFLARALTTIHRTQWLGKKMLEGRSSAVISCHISHGCDHLYQRRTCPREGYAEVAVGMLSVVEEALWSRQISVTRMRPVSATEGHYCISLRSAADLWAWCSSSCSPSNQSSDCNRQSFAVT